MHAETASAGGHGREELAELAGKVGGAATIKFDHLAEEVIGKQADAIRKETEQKAHKEMRGALGINSALAEAE